MASEWFYKVMGDEVSDWFPGQNFGTSPNARRGHYQT